VYEKLQLVNGRLNGLPWIADPDLWKRIDYWATPLETLATFGGDCEDIAIAKYLMLYVMGISTDQLFMAYVLNSRKQRHMVLLYRESSGSEIFVLDNEHHRVLPATKRRDLIGIYVFNNDGTLYLIKDDGVNERKVKTKIDNKYLAKWASVKERSRKNREMLRKYNRGRPLIPVYKKTDQPRNN
jgi:hypothetical protein